MSDQVLPGFPFAQRVPPRPSQGHQGHMLQIGTHHGASHGLLSKYFGRSNLANESSGITTPKFLGQANVLSPPLSRGEPNLEGSLRVANPLRLRGMHSLSSNVPSMSPLNSASQESNTNPQQRFSWQSSAHRSEINANPSPFVNNSIHHDLSLLPEVQAFATEAERAHSLVEPVSTSPPFVCDESTLSSSEPYSSSPAARAILRKTLRQQQDLAVPPVAPTQSRWSTPASNSSQNQDAHLRFSHIDLPHAPPVARGTRLVNPRDVLPDNFRALFPYPLFNVVQSRCFDSVYNSTDNLVVSAPTASGKTAVLELAICKLVADSVDQNFKVVYQAPTKALCTERARDWEKKFRQMNLRCAELTGDTSQAEMRRVCTASLIVTTPEKWDSVTRKWQDHRKLLKLVKLFLIDEVHILKDARGATLEAVVSRMKAIGTNVRFVALSATVPNSEDIAEWLGRNHHTRNLPACLETFGEDFRPVKLQKHVYGYDYKGNDFIFDKYLDQKLITLLSKHADGKPILIFCFTRKSCESTAAVLAEWWSSTSRDNKPWKPPTRRVHVLNSDLQETVKSGIAFHHAGLDARDRTTIEESFLGGELSVICCTSTLAVGINLPCHTVVLKGTFGFSDDRLQELSDLEVMQMLGRAGRPQFDTSAVAIILTRTANKNRYERMASGQEVLESTLHANLIEHLNSEICLGTINSVQSAAAWLKNSFLSIRLRKNPGFYQLTPGTSQEKDIRSSDNVLEGICSRDIEMLREAGFATDNGQLRSTEYGWAMSRYLVSFSTMTALVKIPRAASMEIILIALCQAKEFAEFRFRPVERSLFRDLNKSPLILHPIKEPVTKVWHKIFLMVQTELGCVQYPETNEVVKLRRQLFTEKKTVLDLIQRLLRCIIECKESDLDSVGIKNALELGRSTAAKAWDGRATQLTQVPGFGPAAMRRLAGKGIRTISELAERDYAEIERLMGRNAPFGKVTAGHLDKFPRLGLEIEAVNYKEPNYGRSNHSTASIVVRLKYTNLTGLPNWMGKPPNVTFLSETDRGELLYFWRGNIEKFSQRDGLEIKFEASLTSLDHKIMFHFSCEEIVGTTVSKSIKHNFAALIVPSAKLANTESNRQAESNENPLLDASDLDDGGICDEDLLEAVDAFPSSQYQDNTEEDSAMGGSPFISSIQHVKNTIPAKDRLLRRTASQSEYEKRVNATHEQHQRLNPSRMPNGRWLCNHTCSGGALTKAGKQCTHRCCQDGLEKPPRKRKSEGLAHETLEVDPKRQKSRLTPDSTRLKTNAPDKVHHPVRPSLKKVNHDGVDVEFIDLCGDTPSPPSSPIQGGHEAHRRTPRDLTDSRRDKELAGDMADELPFNISLVKADEPRPSPKSWANQAASQKECPLDQQPAYEKDGQISPHIGGLVECDGSLKPQVMVDKEPHEPEWISRVDPEIVDIFRGCVNFV